MRTIKFRAYAEKGMSGDQVAKYWLSQGFDESRPEIVFMQFTGLLDKNGKEIYEGDIVKCEVHKDYQELDDEPVQTIRFDKELRFSTCAKDYNFGLPMTWGGYKSLEVIGNIYENHELL